MIRCRLKEATEKIHSEIEESTRLLSPTLSLTEYQTYLAKLYGFYTQIECQCDFFQYEFERVKLNLLERKKMSLLEQDLIECKITPTSIPLCIYNPSLKTFADCLGCLYVLEGSTLGSQFVLSHLKRRFHPECRQWSFHYLDCYGIHTREMWNKFLQSLNYYSQLHPQEDDIIIDSAIQTFTNLGLWLKRE